MILVKLVSLICYFDLICYFQVWCLGYTLLVSFLWAKLLPDF